MSERTALFIVATLAACLAWPEYTIAQRPGTVERRGAANRGALPRPQPADLTCTVSATDGENGVPHWTSNQFTNGEVHETAPPGGTVGYENYRVYINFEVVNEGAYGTAQFPSGLGIKHNGATVPHPSLTSVGLLAGATTRFGPYEVEIPRDQPGLHEIMVTGIVDGGNFSVPESDESDNICRLNFTIAMLQWCEGGGWKVECPLLTQGVAPEPKLELTFVSVNPSNWRATAKVKNTGNGASETFNVSAVFAEPGCGYQPIITPMAGPSLSPGEEVELSRGILLIDSRVAACLPERGAEFDVMFRVYPSNPQYKDNLPISLDSEIYTGTRPVWP